MPPAPFVHTHCLRKGRCVAPLHTSDTPPLPLPRWLMSAHQPPFVYLERGGSTTCSRHTRRPDPEGTRALFAKLPRSGGIGLAPANMHRRTGDGARRIQHARSCTERAKHGWHSQNHFWPVRVLQHVLFAVARSRSFAGGHATAQRQSSRSPWRVHETMRVNCGFSKLATK